MATEQSLGEWIALQLSRSKHNLALSISATHLCRERKEFGQRIVPAKGSVLASPVIANWDPEPDYFFHWTRDAAAVMRAVVDLVAMSGTDSERKRWQAHFLDMVDFSLALTKAPTLQASVDYQARTQEDCRQFLRPAAELEGLQGDKLLAEPRFNPDGSLDVLRWSRPQLDGPPLRALACLAWLAEDGEATPNLTTLLETDLRFTLRNAGRCSIGPWEESHEYSHHYFVELSQLAALVHGRHLARGSKSRWQRAEQRLRRGLDKYWQQPQQVYSAIRGGIVGAADTEPGTMKPSQLIDSSVLLSQIEAELPGDTHNAADPRALATLEALAQAFATAFGINQHLPQAMQPALGRSLGDRYFGGGAWYVTTLAAASFCYQRARVIPGESLTWLQRGDAWMATVRWLTPTDGSMSEQVGRDSKQPTSARHLTWSYAAFISTARRRLQWGPPPSV